MNEIRKSTIFHAGQKQVMEIPAEFELADGDVSIRKDGDHLVVATQPAPQVPTSWADFLDALPPLEVDWPDVDEGQMPTEDVSL